MRLREFLAHEFLDVDLLPTDLTACRVCFDSKPLGEMHDIGDLGLVCHGCIRKATASASAAAVRGSR